MWENDRKFHKTIVGIVAVFAVVMLVMGLAGCSTDRTQSTSDPNGVTVPVPETPENPSYTVTQNRTSLILGGVNSGNGAPDPLCGLDITVDDGEPGYLVDALVELRWTDSDYPNRNLCSTGSGVTGSHSNGVWHLYAYTDAYGVAHFRVAGNYTGSTGSCGGGEGSSGTPRKGKVFVEGVEQTNAGGWFNVSTADLNGSDGVNSADLSLFLTDDGCGNYYSRSDFDGDGDVDSADEDILDGIINGGGSTASACE
jgi:hypothetical protein